MRRLLYVLEAWVTLAWLDFRISATAYSTWKHYFDSASKLPTQAKAQASNELHTIIRSAESAARHHWRPMNCLRRCIAQQRMLNRRGFASQLHIGVTKEGGVLAAHAWLSDQGKIINDSIDVDERYQELKIESWMEVADVLD